MKYFNESDLKKLWKNAEDYTVPMPNEEELRAIEDRLGTKLPASYIEFSAEGRNGCLLKRNAFPLRDNKGNVIRHVKIECIEPIRHFPGNQLDPERYPAFDSPRLFYKIPKLYVIATNYFGNGYDFFVLNYLDCAKDGEPPITYITRKARKNKHDEPPRDKGDWRHINDEYYWEAKTVACDFVSFINELVVMPKQLPFNFEALKEQLKLAVKKSFCENVKAHGAKEIISYGLYVDDEASMISDSVNIKKHLDKLVSEDPENKDYFTYATNEWRYEGTGFAINQFDSICREVSRYSITLDSDKKTLNFRNKILDACTEVLAELKKEGFFHKEYHLPILLSVSVSDGDVAKVKAKKIRELLA